MDKNKLIDFIQESFLKPFLSDSEITDVSFNGIDLFYTHNSLGIIKSDIEISQDDAKDFIRQISNISEKQFSFTFPILDVTCGKYRINAVHQSIGRVNENECLTFSLRIASNVLRISDSSNFLNDKLIKYFGECLRLGKSIVIAGKTGSGKTEFQKYLISKIKSNNKIVIIDNVLELENVRNYSDADITTWQLDERNSSNHLLIRNSLRSNPDWLILAEARGKEMVDVLNAAMSGHPTITTIHSLNLESIHSRLARLCLMSEQKLSYEDIIEDIKTHFPVVVYLNYVFDSERGICRYIDSVGEMVNGKLKIIYKRENI